MADHISFVIELLFGQLVSLDYSPNWSIEVLFHPPTQPRFLMIPCCTWKSGRRCFRSTRRVLRGLANFFQLLSQAIEPCQKDRPIKFFGAQHVCGPPSLSDSSGFLAGNSHPQYVDDLC